MSEPTYPLKYEAEPGVVLRKAERPQTKPGDAPAPDVAEYARAPAGPGFTPAQRGKA